jgi:hypothetical protein
VGDAERTAHELRPAAREPDRIAERSGLDALELVHVEPCVSQ